MIDVDLNTYPTGVHAKWTKVDDSKLFFNMFAFHSYLRMFDKVDVATYTFDVHATKGIRLRRVLCHHPCNGQAFSKDQVRLVNNLHAKLYLCFNGKKLVKGFVGSHNMVAPTLIEVMTHIPSSSLKNALAFFDDLWQQAA